MSSGIRTYQKVVVSFGIPSSQLLKGQVFSQTQTLKYMSF